MEGFPIALQTSFGQLVVLIGGFPIAPKPLRLLEGFPVALQTSFGYLLSAPERSQALAK